ncbi:MAG: thymidylate kinase [Methanosaeta sp. PtaU1.Bin016]|nr:MAG: thymidylate kinase [Methanosaeta sp. PtaU1.Bin016]
MPPDLTLFFALDPALALKRMRSRQEREKFEQLEFLRSVNENFRRLVALEPGRFVSIDASRDAQDVAAQALKRILKRVQTSL